MPGQVLRQVGQCRRFTAVQPVLQIRERAASIGGRHRPGQRGQGLCRSISALPGQAGWPWRQRGGRRQGRGRLQPGAFNRLAKRSENGGQLQWRPGQVVGIEQAAVPYGLDLQACRTQVGNLRLLLGCCNLFAHHSAGAHGPCECRQGAGSRFVQYPERAAQMLQLPAQLLHGGGPPGKPVRADARKAPAGDGMHIGQAHHGQQVFRPQGTRALQRALVV